MTGAACAPGDALIGLPSSGLHSNGYTLARRVLEPLGLDTRPGALGGASVADVLLEPTVIYVRAVLELLRSGLPRPRARAHHRRRAGEPAAPPRGVGFAIEAPLPVPPVFDLVREHGAVPRPRCGASSTWAAASSPSCPRPPPDAAVALLAAHHPGTARIGTVTARGRRRCRPPARAS